MTPTAPRSLAPLRFLCLAHFALALPIRLMLAQAPSSADTVGRDAFVRWARSTAHPLARFDTGGASRTTGYAPELRRLTTGARVVAFGESAHDVHEFIVLRNQLTDQLIADDRVSAIVLETGMAEARGIDAWIVGQTDKTPDFAHDLSYGWGVEQEVIDALGRLRALNARRPAARRIHFYGMDMPANGGGSLMPALEPVWAYLAQVDRGASDRSRAALAPIAQRVASNGYDIVAKFQALGPARDTLRRELDALAAGLDANRRAYVARSSPSRYAWAARLAEVARQTERAVRIGWNDASNPRDVAMAANVEWILAREGARGKVVVWAHNLHVARAPITGPIFASRGGAPAVASMGERLQHSLGAGYVPIGTAFARSMADSSALDSSSVDAALAMVGVPRFLLALDPAPSDAPAAAWVRAAHLKRAEDGYVVTKLVPAFDAVVFIDTVRASRHVAAP